MPQDSALSQAIGKAVIGSWSMMQAQASVAGPARAPWTGLDKGGSCGFGSFAGLHDSLLCLDDFDKI